jgi:hypothetical protein
VNVVKKAFEFLARVGKTCFYEEEERGRRNMCSSERFF